MTILDLPHAQRLRISPDGRDIRIEGADGAAGLRITITPEGPVLEVAGAGLRVRCDGALDLEGEDVRLHARRSLQVSSDGDADFAARGSMRSRGSEQELIAAPGDVRIKANDDVRVNGERILMNL